MPAKADIGARIRKRRQVLRLTQEELAAQLGVSKSTVAHWESGKHFPRRYLGAVEEALGVSLDGGEDAAEPELVPEDDWEASVLSDPDLPGYIKNDLVMRSRASRAEYRSERDRRRAARATSRRIPPATAAGSAQGRAAG